MNDTPDFNSFPAPSVSDAQALFPSLEQQYGLPSGTLNGIMMTESSGNPNVPVGRAGDTGIFQFTPGAAKDYNVDPNDPVSSAIGAAKYISSNLQKSGGDLNKALVGYNAGPGNMNQADQSYAKKVLSYMNPIGTANAAESDNTPSAQSLPDFNSFPEVSGNSQLSQSLPDFNSFPEVSGNQQNSPDNGTGLTSIIGSKANSALAGLASNPISQGIGSGVGGLINSGMNAYSNIKNGTNMPVNPLTNIKDAWNNANEEEQAAQQVNPLIYGAGKIAGQIAPLAATGGSSILPRMAMNAAIGGGNAAYNGGSAGNIAANAALSGPGAEVIAAALPAIGNAAKYAGNFAEKAPNLPSALVANLLSKNPAPMDVVKGLMNPGDISMVSAAKDAGNVAWGAAQHGLWSGGVVPAIQVIGAISKNAGALLAKATTKLQGTPYIQVFQNIIQNSTTPEQAANKAIIANQVLMKSDPNYQKVMQ